MFKVKTLLLERENKARNFFFLVIKFQKLHNNKILKLYQNT